MYHLLAIIVFLSLNTLAQAQTKKTGLEMGEELFLKSCAVCHGVDGRANGPVARISEPKPRDFSFGEFRIVSTTNGVPTDDDLLSVIERGMPGSWMPSWKHLKEEEKQALVQYVRELTYEAVKKRMIEDFRSRGEQIDALKIANMAKAKTTPGKPLEVPTEPRVSESGLEHGRQVFARNCASCHGMEGRGDGLSRLEDDRGYVFKPRDLTKGIFKGSSDSNSLYKRIYAGMPGSPMPGFFHLDSQTIWDLVHYVRTLPMPGSEERALPIRRILSAVRKNAIPNAPLDSAWKDIPGVFISLMPMWWSDIRIEGVLVRAVHDGKDFAVQLSWLDLSRNDYPVRFEELADGAGIQFTTGDEPAVGMGSATDPVNLWFWRANWELERRGGSDLKVFYPGMDCDPYPWTPKDCFPKEPGVAISQEPSPVKSSADWMDPGWVVVFRRSLKAPGKSDVDLQPGSRVSVSFAIWDATRGKQQGQSSVSIWHDLFFDP